MRARRGLIRGWAYRRGFVAEVTVDAEMVYRHGDVLANLGPLERLNVRNAAGQLAALLPSALLDRVRDLDQSGNAFSVTLAAQVRSEPGRGQRQQGGAGTGTGGLGAVFGAGGSRGRVLHCGTTPGVGGGRAPDGAHSHFPPRRLNLR